MNSSINEYVHTDFDYETSEIPGIPWCHCTAYERFDHNPVGMIGCLLFVEGQLKQYVEISTTNPTVYLETNFGLRYVELTVSETHGPVLHSGWVGTAPPEEHCWCVTYRFNEDDDLELVGARSKAAWSEVGF